MNRKECLDAADKCVNADRNNQYGPPEDSFAMVAVLWNAYAKGVVAAAKGRPRPFAATDIAAMMVLLKIARLAANPGHADNWVDIAGYAACGAEIATQKTATSLGVAPEPPPMAGRREDEVALMQVKLDLDRHMTERIKRESAQQFAQTKIDVDAIRRGSVS